MPIIIPALLPITKLFGMYGPGFKYSTVIPNLYPYNDGTQANPIIIASSLSNIQIPIKLNILSSPFANYSSYFVNVIIKIYTSLGGVYKYSVSKFISSGTLYTTCGNPLPEYLSNFSTFPPGYSYDVPIIAIDIFKMLRDNIDVTKIEVSSQIGYSSDISSAIYAYWSNNTSAPSDGIRKTIFGMYTASPTCPASFSDMATINLNKSTGFVLTVT